MNESTAKLVARYKLEASDAVRSITFSTKYLSQFVRDWYSMRGYTRELALLKELARRYPYSGKAYRVAKNAYVTPPTSWSKTRAALEHYLNVSRGWRQYGTYDILEGFVREALDLEALSLASKSNGYESESLIKSKEIVCLTKPEFKVVEKYP